jgi:hypothetical protein
MAALLQAPISEALTSWHVFSRGIMGLCGDSFKDFLATMPGD